MTAQTSPALPGAFDMSLADVLDALGAAGEKVLRIERDGGAVRAGYHVTEVKAGAFVTLDCGGNPDAWQETILQVEDIPAPPGGRMMSVGKFRSILAQVDRKVRLDADARLTFEVGVPGVPMQVYDVAGIEQSEDAVVIRLGAREAICKPRHRTASACCAPAAGAATGSACCA
jgi:hypothetical protein